MKDLRNQVVFAPAGSGKTERLSSRYIELLETGVAPERILTLTFTEKAAAEMKERIFKRLSERNPELHRRLRDDALKLRISTIHSFCLTLVRRFAPALGLDPRVDVLADPHELWTSAKYDALMEIAQNSKTRADAYELLLDLITRNDRIGWPKLSGLFDDFFGKRVSIARGQVMPVERERLGRLAAELRIHPLTGRLGTTDRIFPKNWEPASVRVALNLLDARREVFLTKSGTPLRKERNEEARAWCELAADYYHLLRADFWAAEFARSFELFRARFLAAYERSKRRTGSVDYDDMEFLALQLLERQPDWQNILRAFDEHTDHLLVDEFQDTSFLQWGIIDRLTEEWRSGAGAKTDAGITPTIFLVGDDKQSIYMFRDAKVEVFRTAADKLEKWLGKDRLEQVRLEKNYRSLQAIIDFNNAVFSRLMSPTSPEPWRTRYAPFTRGRNNAETGRVEVILTPCEGSADETRACDAETVARRIRALADPADPFVVHERDDDKDETGRACAYRDMAILLRSRKLLPAIEDALRRHNIPLLVAGGAGFYSEPEVRYLIALATVLVDPADDLALYTTLRGPVFSVPERDLFLANSREGMFLSDRVRLAAEQDSALGRAIADIERWRALLSTQTLATALETALADRRVWETFWEPQRYANLRKLLSLIEARETAGDSTLRILCALQDKENDEPKADVRSEGRNAVTVMTIHGAKGLQFPVCFVPGLDDRIRPIHRSSGEPLVIEETGPDEVLVSWLPDLELRRKSQFHMTYREKEIEEEKRVFYVACTRARDGLFLTGALHKKALSKSWLQWLMDTAGLDPENLCLGEGHEIPGVHVLTAADIPECAEPAIPNSTAKTSTEEKRRRPAAGRLLSPPPRVRAVSRSLPQDYTGLSQDAIGTGELIHRILELISSGQTRDKAASHEPLVRREVARLALSSTEAERKATSILKHFAALRLNREIWAIIEPRPDAESELPVMYSDGATVWTGRIDRVIFRPDEVRIYDYKTFPVGEDEVDKLARQYHAAQLSHYAAAMKRMHPKKQVGTFLIFTYLPRIVQTGTDIV